MDIPKQWLYWCKKAGLKPEMRRQRFSQYYLVGRGRRWRINSFGYFQCSCLDDNFDRWANSLVAFVCKLPSTEKEFIRVVDCLSKHAEKMDDDIGEYIDDSIYSLLHRRNGDLMTVSTRYEYADWCFSHDGVV